MFTVCVTLLGEVDEAFPFVTLRAGHVVAVVSDDQTVDMQVVVRFTIRNHDVQLYVFKHLFASHICECDIQTVSYM